MALDGGFLYQLCEELKSATECHIDKIHQPSRDELVFLLRKKGFAKRLFISIRSGSARIHFTEEKYENPETPPMFCMLMRKHLSSAKLIDIIQNGLERVIELIFSATNEMGDKAQLRLICELIGNSANLVLVNEEGRIIDSMRRSDIETSARFVQPGAKYEYPQGLGKLNPLNENVDILENAIKKRGEIPLNKAILDVIEGVSPLVAREIEYKFVNSLDIKVALRWFKDALMVNAKPVILEALNGEKTDFSYMPIEQYSGVRKCVEKESFSKLLDDFYKEKQVCALINQAANDIIKTVNNARSRVEKKRNLRILELEKCKDREKYRIYGELLKANLYMIENGSSFADVQNYYDENLSLIRIPLNSAISPSANAAKYFKEYKKSYTAEQTLSKLIEADEEELNYLDSVADNISRSTTVSEIREIREELTLSGYVRAQKGVGKRVKFQAEYNEYTSVEGYKIIVGKNNLQNDYITCKLASKNDLWFHVKNMAGSHVVVFCGGGEVSDETIEFAATLAAKNSKAASSSNVAVDYTPIKYVKKPNGAKPGMVIYTTNKTVFVTPEVAK